MQDFLAQPFPSRKTACHDLRIVAIDLETTGLDPAQDRILSIGLVEIEQMTIRLNSSWQTLVTSNHPLPEQSVTIHRITDDQSRHGASLEEALSELLPRLHGKVMLAHHATVEQSFLNAACMRLYSTPFLIPTIDTQMLAKRRFERRDQPYQPKDLRLFNLRSHYGLPRYQAHNALSDALATAELFLALTAALAPDNHCHLKDMLC